MFTVVGYEPIWTARDRGEEYGNIRRMTNQMAAGKNLALIRKRDDFRLHQSHQMNIALQQKVRVAGRHPAQAVQKILFDLLAHGFGQNQPAYSVSVW